MESSTSLDTWLQSRVEVWHETGENHFYSRNISQILREDGAVVSARFKEPFATSPNKTGREFQAFSVSGALAKLTCVLQGGCQGAEDP